VFGDSAIQIHSTPLSLFGGISWIDSSVGYALSDVGMLYRTNDSGMSFQLQPQVSSVSKIIVHPAYAGRFIVFMASHGNSSWYTETSGQFYSQMYLPFTDIIFHPLKVGWALATDRINSNTAGSLFFTTQFFEGPWVNISGSAYSASWCNAGSRDVPIDRFCFVADYVHPQAFVIAYQSGRNLTVSFPDPVDNVIFHASFLLIISGGHMQVSSDSGQAFRPSLFPSGMHVPYIQPSHIVDDRHGVVWLGVNFDTFGDSVSRAAAVYVSDGDGFKYTPVLSEVHTVNDWIDFTPIWSLTGSYVSNILLPFGDGTYVGQDGQVMLKTRISSDAGQTWKSLQAPSHDAHGLPVSCKDLCSLNLFGITASFGAAGAAHLTLYSTANAPGLILGTGNVGNFLDVSPFRVNTYLSSDGGSSWIELLKGSYTYAYGERSGILVLLPNREPTTLFYYTLDAGITHYPFNFTDTPVYVESVETRDSEGRRFLVKAVSLNATIYFGIDWSNLQQRFCGAEDYEYWSPDGRKCVLGHTVTYVRRLQTSFCYDNLADTVHSYNYCNCTAFDYECDTNFQKLVSGACSRIQGSPKDPAPEECPPGATHYNKTKGYRKVQTDTCVHELLQYSPTLTSCPQPRIPSFGETVIQGVTPGNAAFAILLVTSVSVVASFVGGVYAAYRSRLVRATVPPSWRSERVGLTDHANW